MSKILISLIALTFTVASAAPKVTMTSSPITPKMTAAMCIKGSGMVKTMSGKKMCVMAPMKK